MMMVSNQPLPTNAFTAYPTARPAPMPQPPMHPSVFFQPAYTPPAYAPVPLNPRYDAYQPLQPGTLPATSAVDAGIPATTVPNPPSQHPAKKTSGHNDATPHKTEDPKTKPQSRFMKFFKSPLGVGASVALVATGGALLWHHSNNSPEKVLKRTFEALNNDSIEASSLGNHANSFGIAMNRLLSQSSTSHDALASLSEKISTLHAKHPTEASLHNALITGFKSVDPATANLSALNHYHQLDTKAQQAIQHAASSWIDTAAKASDSTPTMDIGELIAASQLKLSQKTEKADDYHAPMDALANLWNTAPLEGVSPDEPKAVFAAISPEKRAKLLAVENNNLLNGMASSSNPIYAQSTATDALSHPIDALNHLFNLHATAYHGKTQAERVAAAEAYNTLQATLQKEGLGDGTYKGYTLPFTHLKPIEAAPMPKEGAEKA